jgi:hypothetical protein
VENIILIVIRALGVLGEKGVHFVLDAIEDFVVGSDNVVDNELFYKVVAYIKTWEPKNQPPPE